MKAFLVGLQFLTRISVAKQGEWTAADFGRSVKFFPLIGAVLGTIYAAIAYFLLWILPLYHIVLPDHLRSVILLVMPMLLTGGLHCDGFMDTMDGLFSGRSRERMLEIMKDSCIGAHGAMAFVIFALTEWSVLLDFKPEHIVAAMFVMPVIARMCMVIGISCFPYARPQGMGKAFADHADRKSLLFAFASTCILVAPWGVFAIISMAGVIFLAYCFEKYVTKILGGLTGDVYGAVTQLSELLVLLILLATAQFSG